MSRVSVSLFFLSLLLHFLLDLIKTATKLVHLLSFISFNASSIYSITLAPITRKRKATIETTGESHQEKKRKDNNNRKKMATFTPLQETVLFKPLRLGSLNLEHRVVLAPLTRMRGTKESDGVFVPNDLSVEYYSQRASKGGFMLTEATPISRYVSFTFLQHPSRIE